jgi:predicted RNase H-like HicB family nuclease
MRAPKAVYHGRFELDPSGNWLAELRELPQVRTFGRTLGKAKENLIDALASWNGQHVLDARASIELECTVVLPAAVQEALDLAMGAREILEAITRESSELMAAAALSLVDEAHLSVRDAAGLLDISHQRVHQIISAIHAQRRSEEVRRNVDLVRQHISTEQTALPLVGSLTPAQAFLAAALIVVGGALVVATSNS